MLVDLVKILSTSVGTGAITLGQAVPGYRGTEALTNGETYAYSIQQEGTFEIGRGTLLDGQLVRSPLFSSDGGTAINLSPNAAVSFVALAEDLLPSALTIALRVPEGESLAPLPSAAARANLLVGFDADGNLVVTPGVAGPPGPTTLPSLQSTNDTTDRTAALNALLSTTATAALSAGPYTFASAPSVRNRTLFGFGAQLVGASYPEAPDISVINASGVWYTRATDTGVATYATTSQLWMRPSGSHSRSFESAANINKIIIEDNSIYSSDGDDSNPGAATSARDGVAGDQGFYVLPGIMRARAFGGNFYGRFGNPGQPADGGCAGIEVRVDHFGPNSGPPQTATAKTLVPIVAGGTGYLTAGSSITLGGTAGQAGFYYGYFVDPAAVRDWAFSILELPGGGVKQNVRWGIAPAGWEEMKPSATPATPAAGRVRRYWAADGTMRALFDDGTDAIIASKGLTKRSRAAYVADMPGYDPSGNTDNTAAFQAFLIAAAAAGIPVIAPAGVIKLTSQITIPFGSVFRGMAQGDYATDPTQITTFFIAHSGKGFVWAGALGSTPFDWQGCNTFRNQPAVLSGQPWAPNDHDFDFYLPQSYGCRLANFITYNPTRGIFATGARLHVDHWGGQPYKIGLQVDWMYDSSDFKHVHLWQYKNLTSPEMFAYAYANLQAFVLKRLDNCTFYDCFSIVCNDAWYISYWTNPTNDPSLPAGTCNKLKLIACDSDVGTTGIHVGPEAGTVDKGPFIILLGYTTQGRNPENQISAPQIYVEALNTRFKGDADLSRAGSNGLRVAASATGSKISLVFTLDGYDLVGQGFPGVEVVASTPTNNSAGQPLPAAKVKLLPGWEIAGGGSSPQYTGNVTAY